MFVPLTISRTTAVVFLTRGYNALIDRDSWPVIGMHMWQATQDRFGNVYAIGPCGIRMHQLLCRSEKGKIVDHKNGNQLDNRRSNLRPASKQQNNQNGKGRNSNTGYKGAYFDKSKGIYVAKIYVNGKLKSLGKFSDPIEAARAYDAAALIHYGEFACTNFSSERKAYDVVTSH